MTEIQRRQRIRKNKKLEKRKERENAANSAPVENDDDLSYYSSDEEKMDVVEESDEGDEESGESDEEGDEEVDALNENANITQVHRCRFVDFVPKAINHLVFSPADAPVNKYPPKLAASRANGDIEIYDVASGFTLDTVIRGGMGVSVECLAWAFTPSAGLRLFTGSLSGYITEWDIKTGEEKNVIESYAGPVWCMSVSPDQKVLSAGCETGVVKIYNLVREVPVVKMTASASKSKKNASDEDLMQVDSSDDEDEDVADNIEMTLVPCLEYNNKTLCSAPHGRVLSLAWSENGNLLAYGTGEAAICIMSFDPVTQTGRTLQEISLDNRGTIVWCCAFVSESKKLVAGDSTGHLHFFDVKTGTCRMSFNSHQADILTLAVMDGGKTIIASGIDHSMIQFREGVTEGIVNPNLIPLGDEEIFGGDDNPFAPIFNWVKTGKRLNAHTHDIRSMSYVCYKSCEKGEPDTHLLVSGGLDTQICVFQRCTNESKITRWPCSRIPPFYRSNVKVARSSGIVMYEDDLNVTLWNLHSLGGSISHNAAKQKKPLIQMQLKGPHFPTCSSISPDAQHIVVCSRSESKLFRVNWDNEECPKLIKKRSFLSSLSEGMMGENSFPVSACQFSQDSERLYLASRDRVIVLGHFDKEQGSSSSWKIIGQVHLKRTACVRSMQISPDRSWMAIVNENGRLSLYNLDTFKWHDDVPFFKDGSKVVSMCFHWTKALFYFSYSLPTNVIYSFDLERKSMHCLNPFYRRAGNREKTGMSLLARGKSNLEGIRNLFMNSTYSDKLFFQRTDALYCFTLSEDDFTKARVISQEVMDSIRENNKKEKELKKLKRKERTGKSRIYKVGKGSKGGKGKNNQIRRSKDLQKHESVGIKPNVIRFNEFSPVLHADYVTSGLVVVERPWLSVIEKLPTPFAITRFGN